MSPVLTARQVADVLEQIAPLNSGNAGDEQGFLLGDPGAPVRGVAVMWNAHAQSIAHAVEAGCNLLIVHESPYFRPQESNWYQGPRTMEEMRSNQKRQELIAKHKLVIYRIHSSWDALAEDGVPDQATRALDLGPLKVIGKQKYFKVHEMAQPRTVRDMAGRAQQALELPWFPRVFGPLDKEVRTFAWLIGGFGGNQLNMPEACDRMGAQCLLIGEMLEWFVIQALELEIPVIETLHSRSEIPAIKRQAEMLREKLPGVKVQYVESGALGWSYERSSR